MHYLKLLAFLLGTHLFAGTVEEVKKEDLTIKDRLVMMKDKTVERVTTLKDAAAKKVGAILVIWGGIERENQLKRLEYYQWLLDLCKRKSFLRHWEMYKKRWYPWIITGKMSIKNPDGRITDTKFLEYVIAVESLIKGRSLSQTEKEQVCRDALAEVEAYRKKKGIRV